MMTLEFKRNQLCIYPRTAWLHAMPDTSPVPKHLGLSWRATVSGILVNTRWGHMLWMFRRGHKW